VQQRAPAPAPGCVRRVQCAAPAANVRRVEVVADGPSVKLLAKDPECAPCDHVSWLSSSRDKRRKRHLVCDGPFCEADEDARVYICTVRWYPLNLSTFTTQNTPTKKHRPTSSIVARGLKSLVPTAASSSSGAPESSSSYQLLLTPQSSLNDGGSGPSPQRPSLAAPARAPAAAHKLGREQLGNGQRPAAAVGAESGRREGVRSGCGSGV
jgi:hypothetical protein